MIKGTEPMAATALAALSAGLLAVAVAARAPAMSEQAWGGRFTVSLGVAIRRWRSIWTAAAREGGAAPGPMRRLWLAGSVASAVVGFSMLGKGGGVIGAAAGPYAVHALLKARRERFAARIDACAAEFALALASALAGGNSVRGALLAAARSTPEPLAGELDRVCMDLTLGRDVEAALAALRARTSSPRIDSMVGAIELHRGSGGDLVHLMRELAAAFRTRDIAQRDARAATAQARFTAVVVAAIPLTLAIVGEVARPGSVSGVFAFAPAAVMMVVALVMLAAGCLLCARIGRAG